MRKKSTEPGQRIADFLTAAMDACRKYDAQLPRLTFRSAVFLYTALLLFTTVFAIESTAHAQDWQPTDEIARAAEEFLASHVGKTDRRAKPQAGYLDTRLHLPLCDLKLEGFLRRGTKITSRTVVGVRCSGRRPWKVYVPVDVIVMDLVMVTKKTLARDHVLTAADVVAEERNISRLTAGYISDAAELTGQRLKHQVMGGSLITLRMLVADTVIKRGQTVTLLIQTGGLDISMSGKALMDGAVNQRIRVENSVSQRVVEGLVRSAEYVEILVQ